MTGRLVAAIDLGASSGRVMVGRVAPDVLELTELHRFANVPVRLPTGLHWDILRLYADVVAGLRSATRAAGPDGLLSVGVDAWGVDHGLLDEAGALLGNPIHYRDERWPAAMEAVHDIVSPAELYARTGLQELAFNTIYQLAAARGPQLDAAATMLLIPDLFAFWLSGVRVAERTNASTTGLLDVRHRTWDLDLAARLGIPSRILAPLGSPGEIVGPLRDEVRTEVGATARPLLTLVGSHDTASAVVGVPAGGDASFAYIACGTWSLVGVELEAPILGEASRTAGFTNEGGVDGRIRYLRNVMGLWLLQESMRTWELAGTPEQLESLLAAAADLPRGGPVVDPSDPVFLPPGDMPARIEAACRRSDRPAPATRPALVRCILDSLAAAYGRTIRDAEALTGQAIRVVHLVGGGARNALLCQLTADACELPVLAGPVEATAIGNVLVQARAHGLLGGDLESLRGLVRSTQEIRRFEPRRVAARGRA
jgi:rhamnulokinase